MSYSLILHGCLPPGPIFLACGDGWGLCRSEGYSTIEDDFADIYSRFVSKNKIVLITPVYCHDLAENMKCWLDRMRRCDASHNYLLRGKKCLLVACAGGTGNGAIR
ncbi:MAG: NAD(P)H-dependent oxidoreductase [Deltaproteobacteria bacterium]|jgi:multimeric flavodoxin WrbA|nr:NAD(P)H-dependent oxidoreductase [Deltaproteobacteria bacterium]